MRLLLLCRTNTEVLKREDPVKSARPVNIVSLASLFLYFDELGDVMLLEALFCLPSVGNK